MSEKQKLIKIEALRPTKMSLILNKHRKNDI